MARKNISVNYDLGWVFGLAFLIMLVTKVTGYHDYSWWVVTAPLYVPILLVLGFVCILLVGGLLVTACISVYEYLKSK